MNISGRHLLTENQRLKAEVERLKAEIDELHHDINNQKQAALSERDNADALEARSIRLREVLQLAETELTIWYSTSIHSPLQKAEFEKVRVTVRETLGAKEER